MQITDSGSRTVSKPAPEPKPTPKAEPASTPTRTPAPRPVADEFVATRTSTQRTSAPSGRGGPEATPTPGPTPTPTPTPTATPTGSSATTGADLPRATSPAAEQIRATDTYKKLSAEDQTRVEHVMSASSEAGLQRLHTLMVSQPQKLQEKDSQGNTLLRNLDTLATQKMNTAFNQPGAYTRAQVMDSVLKDVVAPGEMVQANRNTCGAECLQYEVASRTPSEYARLMAGLTGESGKARMRGGGDLPLEGDYLKNDSGDYRSPSDTIFQNSIMQRVTGNYDPKTDTNHYVHIGNWGIAGQMSGYATSSAIDTMNRLFGNELNYHKGGAGDVFIAMDPKTMGHANPNFIRNLDPSKGPCVVDVVLDGMSTSHAVSVLRIEKDPGGDPSKDRVVFRNPWGPGNGRTNSGTPVDESQGVYSMTVDEFARRTQSWAVPYPEVPQYQTFPYGGF